MHNTLQNQNTKEMLLPTIAHASVLYETRVGAQNLNDTRTLRVEKLR